MKPFIIIGAGGFAQEVAWAARRMGGLEIIGLCDDDAAKRGTVIAGVPVLGTIEEADAGLGPDSRFFICATGNNRLRAEFARRAEALGWEAVTIVDPSVLTADNVRLGRGVYVGAGTILSCNAEIRNHVLVNQHCTIGHDTVLENFSQAAPGARLSGGVILRTGACVGSGAIVRQCCEIGEWAMVGGGSFAATHVRPGATVIGNPACIVLLAENKKS